MKTFFIRTYGCQMNELDSELMAGLLQKRGLNPVDEEEKADIIIFNTCSVRDLAERKVLGKIGILSRKKKKRIIGITGCMASLKKESLLAKLPSVDFILGTNNISDLNAVLDEVIEKKIQLSLAEEKNNYYIDYSSALRTSKIQASVSIIRGCNNFCSYCIVPYARGREISRSPESIVEECKALVDKGYKEITLLGQNVNSYGKDNPSFKINFADLLYKLDKIKGIGRIRFLTSHPKDITEELIVAIRDLSSVCKHVHFPFQSGSSRILKLMNRNYTREDYLQKIKRIKELVPNVSLGTDIIVGFPSETDYDFNETCTLMEEVRFSSAFIFIYSPRKNTPAYKLTNDVAANLKKERHQQLLKLYQKILDEDSLLLLNSTAEVLVESYDMIQKIARGRTGCFKKVAFKGDERLVGSFQKVRLKSHHYQTFFGEIIPIDTDRD
jgi:tRNA-2-methylthio-N6-dimethylallyladenosine synthase